MAASMSWKRFGGRGNVSASPTSENSNSLTSQVQTYCSLHYPVRTRCLELESLIRRSSSKDLNGVFSLLLDSIFGLNGQQGWGLHTLTSHFGKDDYKSLLDFMSPSGPLFLMVYKLQSDQYLRYEFPVDRLPAPTRESLSSGIIPPFYQGKVAYQAHGRAPSAVMLNAYEYYMFIFAYFLISDRVHRAMNCWSQPQDCFYPVLLDQYLSYFLRSDGRAVPPVPVTSSTPSPTANRLSPYRLPQYGVLYHYLHSYNSGGPDGHSLQRSPSQHHGSSLSLHSHSQQQLPGLSPGGLGGGGGAAPGISFQQAVQDDPRAETWRSEVLVQALAELWLNQNSLQVPRDKGFLSHVKENFIPSQDHVRVVRILVKRLHFFVNSAQPNYQQSAYQQRPESAMEELKRCILPVFVQKPLYVFLRHGFDNWPLDSSFRQILELWLSYIQPWRYVEEPPRPSLFHRDGHTPLASTIGASLRQGMSPQRDAGTRSFSSQDERWPRFVRENLFFYTVLFQELMPRIFHQDLSIPNNALMVYRVAKVFGQSNLSNAMRDAENHLLGLLQNPSQSYVGGGLSATPSFVSLSSSLSSSSAAPPHPLSALGPRLYTHLFEVEAGGFAYKPLFLDSGKPLIEQLQGFISQALVTVKTMAGPSLTDITQTIKSLFSTSLRQANHSALFDDIGPVDTRKTEAYLKNSADFLADIFEVPVPHPDDSVPWNVGQIGRDLHLPPDTMDGTLTPLGRYQLMNRLRSSDVHYHGDPDLQPIRTFENATLVRMLHTLSCHFNKAFGDQIIDTCDKGGLLGAMARWYFSPRAPPPSPTATTNTSSTADITSIPPSWYHPRLSLRFLASYRSLLYLALLYVTLLYTFDISVTGFVLFLFAAALFVGFLGSLFEYLRTGPVNDEVLIHHNHRHRHDSSHTD